jgi:hypothetical protein
MKQTGDNVSAAARLLRFPGTSSAIGSAGANHHRRVGNNRQIRTETPLFDAQLWGLFPNRFSVVAGYGRAIRIILQPVKGLGWQPSRWHATCNKRDRTSSLVGQR